MKLRRFAGLCAVAAALLLPPAAASAATLAADYRFQDGYASSVGTPSSLHALGAPTSHLFVREQVDGVGRTVNTFTAGSGYRAITSGLIPSDAYTIVALARFDSLQGFVRVAEFKEGTSDAGLYLYRGRLRFYDHTGNGPTDVARDQWVQIVLTRNAAGRVRGYVNGTQQWSFDDAVAGDAVMSGSKSDELRFFFDNLTGGGTGEHASGAVARIRLYDGPLTASAVAALNREPPLLKVSPSSAPHGETVTLRGYGFSPSEPIDLDFLDTLDPKSGDTQVNPLAGDTANGIGNFTADVSVDHQWSCNSPDYFRATGQSSGLRAKRRFGILTC